MMDALIPRLKAVGIPAAGRNRPACMTRYDNIYGSRDYGTQPIAEYES